MRQLFITSSISLILAMFNGSDKFLFNLSFYLNTKKIESMNTIIIKPRLSNIEINDGLSKIFEDEFNISNMLFNKERLFFINFNF